VLYVEGEGVIFDLIGGDRVDGMGAADCGDRDLAEAYVVDFALS
jgi:hypothetical protein